MAPHPARAPTPRDTSARISSARPSATERCQDLPAPPLPRGTTSSRGAWRGGPSRGLSWAAAPPGGTRSAEAPEKGLAGRGLLQAISQAPPPSWF